MQATEAIDLASVVITESRPNDVLASLHESAHSEREYLFAARDADSDDLVLVAWLGEEAVGYIAVTDRRSDGLLLWEHLVVPALRGQGLGRRLLLEAARRAMPGAIVVVDPLGELDSDRVVDYYRRLGFDRGNGEGRIWATANDIIRAVSDGADHRELRVTVSALLERTSRDPVTVQPSATVAEAVALLNQEAIGALVVSSDGARIEGMFSERDVLVGIDDLGADFLDRAVGDVATTDVVTCTVGDPIASAMDVMTRQRARHLPVTRTGQLAGVISIGDLVSYRLDAVESAAFANQAGLAVDE
ncbi:MAG: GNAT family N-acetyltransferase [Actinomycetota bacterium]